MQSHSQGSIVAGTALAAMALTFSSIGVVAQDGAAPSASRPCRRDMPSSTEALGAEQPFQDTTVTMQTQWITAEGDDFSAALDPFRDGDRDRRPCRRGSLGPARAAGERVPQRRCRGGHHRPRAASRDHRLR